MVLYTKIGKDVWGILGGEGGVFSEGNEGSVYLRNAVYLWEMMYGMWSFYPEPVHCFMGVAREKF